jgi:hypothetical protein
MNELNKNTQEEKLTDYIATAIINDEVDYGEGNEIKTKREEVVEEEVSEETSASEDKKPDLSELEYSDGKERDEVDLIEEQEKLYGTDVVSPFKTADVRVFRKKLESMSREQMSFLAQRVAARTYSSDEDQKSELMRAFQSWLSTNGFIQTSSSKKAEKGALSEAFEDSKSVNTLNEKLKSKTLSDLQETAARLGFNPSFDRERLITVITQEYQRQS